jgi:hypothetical protein
MTTEYTQSGSDRFLAYIPSWWKNRPWLVRVGGAHSPLSLYLPSCTKGLHCTLQLSGQIHYPYFISTLYVLCGNDCGYFHITPKFCWSGYPLIPRIGPSGSHPLSLFPSQLCKNVCQPYTATVSCTLIKRKENFSRIKGNSDGNGCKVIYEEGLPNICGNVQIFSHIWGGR